MISLLIDTAIRSTLLALAAGYDAVAVPRGVRAANSAEQTENFHSVFQINLARGRELRHRFRRQRHQEWFK